MKITWLSTASILIEHNHTHILFDPYLKSYQVDQLKLFDDLLKNVQAVLITHPHFDHFSDMDDITKKSQIPIYVCKKGIKIAQKNHLPLEQFHEIVPFQQIDFDCFKIKTYQSCHCVFDYRLIVNTLKRALKLKNIKKTFYFAKLNHIYKIDKRNDVYGYEIHVKNIHIFLLGSANLKDDVTYPENIDILIYPYQGRSDLVEYSLKIFKKLKPKIIILDHFDDAFPPLSSYIDYQSLVDVMKIEMPQVQVIVPEKMKPIVFDKNEDSFDKKVIYDIIKNR